MSLSRLSALLLLSGAQSLLASTGPYTFQGCYKEQPGRLLNAKSTVSQNYMTPDLCATYCAGYKYFGVEWSVECYCGDSIPNAVSASAGDCNFPCSGDSTKNCGGSSRVGVWKDTSTVSTVQGTCSVSSSNPDVALVGSAYVDNSAQSFVLTNPVNNVVGGIWANQLVKVTESFSVSFGFKLTHAPGGPAGCNTPANPFATADGIAFVVSPNKNTTIGHAAKNIGYDFLNNFAIEFDSYQNTDFNDPSQFHIGAQSCGKDQNSADHNGPCKQATPVVVSNQCFDNVPHTAVVNYNANTHVITVYYDSQLYLTVNYNLAANLDLINTDRAYIGFVGSTGGQFSRQEITSVNFNCQVPPPPPPPSQCTLNPALASSVNLINVVGNAQRDPVTPSYVLTTPLNYQAGAVWIKQAVNVTKAFHVDWTFNLTHKPNTAFTCKTYPYGKTADGIAFIINANSNNKVSTSASGLGYSGLTNNIAIEFDTYPNSGYHDSPFAHVGVQSCGKLANNPDHGGACAIVPPRNFTSQCFDGLLHNASLTYDGSSMFKVYMDGVQVQSFTYALKTNLALINGSFAYLGFTGSTGGTVSRQEINFVSYPCN